MSGSALVKRTVKVAQPDLERVHVLAAFVTEEQRFRFGKGTTAEAAVLALALKRGLEVVERDYIDHAPATLVVEARGRVHTRVFASQSAALLALMTEADVPHGDLWSRVPGEGEALLKLLAHGKLVWCVRFFDRTVLDSTGSWDSLPPVGCLVGSDAMRRWLRQAYAADVSVE